jgi:hypothetical protein
MLTTHSRISVCQNLVGGAATAASGRELDVVSPYTGKPIGRVRLSTEADGDDRHAELEVSPAVRLDTG